MRSHLVSLGDSLSCGEGVGLRVPLERTWPALLSGGLGVPLVPLAAPGARTADVRARQLPQALALRPRWATLLVGLNDAARAGWDPVRVADDLGAVVRAMTAAGTVVVLGRLHDPAPGLPLPPRLRALLSGRVATLCRAVDALRGDGVLVLDLRRVTDLERRGAWSVDRVHPSPAGHAAVAAAAGQVLRASGTPVGRTCQVTVPPGPGAVAEAAWGVRHGLPWLAGHLREVALPAARLSAVRAR